MPPDTFATAVRPITLISLERSPAEGPTMRIGELVTASAVQAAGLISDVREFIRNLTGGSMRRYETLLEATIERAKAAFREKLRAEGYDGALGVRFSHPVVVDRGAEIIVYGTGFRWATSGAVRPPSREGESRTVKGS